jgi:hypothetical protein
MNDLRCHHFKARWESTFSKDITRDKPFKRMQGRGIQWPVENACA